MIVTSGVSAYLYTSIHEHTPFVRASVYDTRVTKSHCTSANENLTPRTIGNPGPAPYAANDEGYHLPRTDSGNGRALKCIVR